MIITVACVYDTSYNGHSLAVGLFHHELDKIILNNVRILILVDVLEYI